MKKAVVIDGSISSTISEDRNSACQHSAVTKVLSDILAPFGGLVTRCNVDSGAKKVVQELLVVAAVLNKLQNPLDCVDMRDTDGVAVPSVTELGNKHLAAMTCILKPQLGVEGQAAVQQCGQFLGNASAKNSAPVCSIKLSTNASPYVVTPDTYNSTSMAQSLKDMILEHRKKFLGNLLTLISLN